MKYHIIAFFVGFILDFILGDPPFLPHPVRLIGRTISLLEKSLHRKEAGESAGENRRELVGGVVLAASVPTLAAAVTGGLLWITYRLHPWAGTFLESLMTYQILAMKCLKVESMKVYHSLKKGDCGQARTAVSMIVGRDTDCLDERGIARAAIETVAENTSDGVIAPMLCLALGGPVFGFFYKAVNTMDSMVGYRNENYLYFGRAAAKLDDAVNFIPARVSAWFMILAAFLLSAERTGKQSGAAAYRPERRRGSFSAKNAVRIYRRDRGKHASPNAAQTESVCAGALGIRLGGDARYFGKTVKKPDIGDALREVDCEDIRRANCLMYAAAWLCEGICLLLMVLSVRF